MTVKTSPGRSMPGKRGWRSRAQSCGTSSAATSARRRRATPRTSPAGYRRWDRAASKGPKNPDGVDLDETAQAEYDGGYEHEQRRRLDGVLRPEPAADDVALGLPRGRRSQCASDARVWPSGPPSKPASRAGNKNSWIRKSLSKKTPEPGKAPPHKLKASDGPRHGDRLDDRKTTRRPNRTAGRRVGNSPETLEHGHQQQRDADYPVDLAGLAKGTGEENTADVERDRGHEDKGRPVVGLAHHQAGPHAERDVYDRGVGLLHRLPIESLVGAVVDDDGGRGRCKTAPANLVAQQEGRSSTWRSRRP